MTTAITPTTVPIMEIATREGADGRLYNMIEMLARTDQTLMYADWTPCNSNLTHKGARWSTEPTVSERVYDEGVPATFATSTPYEEPTTEIADWIVMDADKLNDRREKTKFWDEECGRHFASFRKAFGDRIYYGDRGTYPKRLRGFCYRSAYNTLSSTYVFDNGGGSASATANKTSVWVLRFGPSHLQFTYPQYDDGAAVPEVAGQGARITGAVMGFKTYDYGLDLGRDASNNEYPAFKCYWRQRFGMVVHDPRAVARIANISCNAIDETDDFSFNHLYLYDVLGKFEKYFGNLENTIIVVPSIVRTQIAKSIDQKANVFASVDDPFGRPISAFNYGVKIPICVSDAIVESEAKVV